MTENMKNFLEKVSEDKALAEKMSKLDKAELIIAAKELGFELTETDFAQPEGELSEDELATVSGGGECYCVVGGGGTKGESDDTCACPVFGFGMWYGTIADGTYGHWTRCSCPGAGYGKSKD